VSKKSIAEQIMPSQSATQSHIHRERISAEFNNIWKQEMKLLKVFVPAIAIMALALGGIPAQAAQKVRIGVTMAVFDDVWLTLVRDAMTKWAKSQPDVELTIVDASNDTAKQVGQVENFLAQGMDAVVILPVDTAATGPMTKAVVKAAKPLVYVNRKPANLPKQVVYCGSKSIEAGIMNMEELGKAMDGKGNLAILMGQLDNEAAIGRTEGIKQVCKEKFPAIKIVREETGNWKRDQGKTIMENWLASGQEINGVASNNDEMALGALQAIKAAKKLGKIPVGGTDGSHDALEAMAKGDLNNTVFQDPVGQGEEAVNAAYLMVKKEPNPKVVDGNIWIPYQKVTKENYKSFMK
jgi:inositol transport system substrate-binding protein